MNKLKQKGKVSSLSLLVILFLMLMTVLLSSCSQVFDAGVSGHVFYYDSGNKVSVPDVDVNVYLSENGSAVAKAKTNADGSFTVNRIVWKTNKSDFGKTADYQTIYLEIPYNESTDDFKQKIQGKIPVSIVSDSTNADMANIEMVKVRYNLPVFTGRVFSDVTTPEKNDPTDVDGQDNVKIYLCSDKSLDSIYSNGFAYAYTTSEIDRTYTAQESLIVNTVYVYNHGNFTIDGSSIKYKLSDEDLSKEEASCTVYLIFDTNNSGDLDSGDYVAEKTFRCRENNVEVKYVEFKEET